MEIRTNRLPIYDGLELKEAVFRQQSFPEHFHDSYSIGIIEKGSERLFYGDKEVIAHAGAVTIINPYDVHSNRYFDQDVWKYRALYVSIDAMRYIQESYGLYRGKELYFPQQLIDDPYLYHQLLTFHVHTDNHADCLNNILRYAIQHYADIRPELRYVNLAITDAAHYMASHFFDKLSVDDLAKQFGMDKYTFIRQFKKQTGLTPISYMLLHRINRSKILIAEDMPITSVALETGFYDQSHFIHYFKKYIGISPSKYKKGLLDME